MKKLMLICAPVSSRSGYGDHARDLVRAFLKIDKFDIKIQDVNWGETPNFDMIINATSIGLKNEDGIKLDYSQIEPNKFFYDVIYNPKETNFLRDSFLKE